MGEETVLVAARVDGFRTGCAQGVRRSDFLCSFPDSGLTQVLDVGQIGANDVFAGLTVCCSLCWSVLVAAPNQTVIDVQRTDSVIAV